ncbi:MAG: hypothetical protein ACE5HP_11545 [Gemmatimonadota bacterium]
MRPEAGRRFPAADEEWLAIEGWRTTEDQGLCYFLHLADGRPDADDRTDRRALLESGERLGEMEEARLRELLAGAVPLTETERRLVDPSGEVWLAQSTGPVWAGEAVAEGMTGILFLSLESGKRLGCGDGSLAGLSEEELRDLLAQALERETSG